ncbi:hypothetical protein IFM89_019840 [Coptis chinensis]|uniref:RBR-type E3 ubiquitin transferase n=1 Tax=Coptis chinensis TaxID=261450 RepID=A0A835HWX0_9MAGN|nr:hypothetical protein IFM89_019840 [Coptis chinensis]
MDSEDNMDDFSYEYEYEYDDDDDDDDGNGVYNEDSNETTTIHRKKYIVLNKDDIQQRQEDDITKISSLLSITRVSATILLLHYKWSVNKLQDDWFADEEKVRTAAGLFEKPIVHYQSSNKVTCAICFEEYTRSRMPAAGCGHLFCVSCWNSYISTSIKDGSGCLMLRCPDPPCGATVGEDMINRLVSEDGKEKYSRYFIGSYVEGNQTMKWCPGAGCGYAVELAVDTESYDVSCNCTFSFCWNCTEDAHRPVDCSTVSKWTLKNKDESENVNWILANSKACPKCKRPIQKNQGCSHMTCRYPCKFQFCWLCLSDWSNHPTCNRYDGTGKNKEIERKRKMAKKLLDRYSHYYERWAANHSSRKKAIVDLNIMQTEHMENLSNKQCTPETQLTFITDAWLQIIECRRVLKWTYAYGYYLPEDEDVKRQLFEFLQGQAESGLERLHECAEKDLQVYLNAEHIKGFDAFRIKLAGLTRVTKDYFENLVQALENGLSDVDTDRWWSCTHCTYFNQMSAADCKMCILPRIIPQ